jgi:hypothetical protein
MPTYGRFADPYQGIGQGMSTAASAIADAITEARKAKEGAAGAQILADQALQSGAITHDQYAKFVNGSATQKNAMTGAFIHAMTYQNAQSEALDRDRRTRLAFQQYNQQLGQQQYERNWTPPATVNPVTDPAGNVLAFPLPTGPGGGVTYKPPQQDGPIVDDQGNVIAWQQGGHIIRVDPTQQLKASLLQSLMGPQKTGQGPGTPPPPGAVPSAPPLVPNLPPPPSAPGALTLASQPSPVPAASSVGPSAATVPNPPPVGTPRGPSVPAAQVMPPPKAAPSNLTKLTPDQLAALHQRASLILMQNNQVVSPANIQAVMEQMAAGQGP